MCTVARIAAQYTRAHPGHRHSHSTPAHEHSHGPATHDQSHSSAYGQAHWAAPGHHYPYALALATAMEASPRGCSEVVSNQEQDRSLGPCSALRWTAVGRSRATSGLTSRWMTGEEIGPGCSEPTLAQAPSGSSSKGMDLMPRQPLRSTRTGDKAARLRWSRLGPRAGAYPQPEFVRGRKECHR